MLRFIAAVFALFSLAAEAGTDVAARVQGEWLVTSGEDLLTSVLQVDKHKADGPGRVEFYGYFGKNGERFPRPLDVAIATGEGELKLSATVAGTRIEAVRKGENLFIGRAVGSRGAYPIRLERLPADEIAERWLNLPPLSKGARTEVIYLSTEDCTYCKGWEVSSRPALFTLIEGKSVPFVEVKGPTLRLPIDAKHYPASHTWVYQQLGASRGVPRFLLAIDGKVMLNVFGTVAYDKVFFPALKEVLARRDAG